MSIFSSIDIFEYSSYFVMHKFVEDYHGDKNGATQTKVEYMIVIISFCPHRVKKYSSWVTFLKLRFCYSYMFWGLLNLKVYTLAAGLCLCMCASLLSAQLEYYSDCIRNHKTWYFENASGVTMTVTFFKKSDVAITQLSLTFITVEVYFIISIAVIFNLYFLCFVFGELFACMCIVFIFFTLISIFYLSVAEFI